MSRPEHIGVTAGGDDDLHNYDVEIEEDIFRPVNTQLDVTAPRPLPKKTSDALGIKDEIQITKQRKPRPKLDENLYVSIIETVCAAN